ncbi:MAG: hypothetical protein DCC71_03505 [Proteobacteria bacterium]|nr:MAG: hypothetical protein DCC71_03505 [Pseudomonadota bacterium]
MRRPLIGALGLFAIAAGALAGLAVSARLAPERLRAALEERLTAELGPVEIGEVRPFFGWGLGIELRDLRIPGEPGERPIAADRVWITLSPRSVVRGEPRAHRVDVRGLDLALARRADGRWTPHAVDRLVQRAQPGPGGQTAGAPARSLREIASALPAVSVEDAALRVAFAEPAQAIALRRVQVTLSHDPFGGAPQLRGTGRIGDSGRDAGGFELDGVLDETGPRGTLALADADLALAGPWLAARGVEAELAGRASGVAAWTPAAAGGALDLELVGLGVRAVDRARPLEVAVASAHASARVEIDPQHVRVSGFEWRGGGSQLAGNASIERPISDAAKLSFELRGGPLSLPALRDLVLAASPPQGAQQRNVASLRGGAIKSFALHAGETPLSFFHALAGGPRAKGATLADLWPETVSVDATLDAVEIAQGDGQPIRDLRGRVHLERDRLRIEDMRARIGDRPLPQLWLSVQGLRAVSVAFERGVVPRPVPPLPGRIALDDWIESKKKPGSPPRWRSIEVDADWIEHPVLLRPLEETTAVLAPANPGVHIREAKGYWGGVPFRGKGSYRGGDQSRIDVEVALSLPRREGRRRADAAAWGRARFHARLEKLGDFQAEWLDGVAQAVGDRVELRRGAAHLRPRGSLRGSVDLDLSESDAVPYRADLQLENGSFSDLLNDIKLDGGSARGTADLDASLAGKLVIGHSMLADMQGTAFLRLREGEINKRMNVLLAIAQASDTLNPFRSRETIPYERIDAPLTLKDGFLETDGFTLQGPAVRMMGTGRVNVVRAPYDLEAVIGIFFFRTLDRVIGVFPILNRLLLGPDDNLVSTYFAMSGPWGDPQARLVPVKSFASGPASFVLEGLPAFVRGGLSRLERMLGGGAAESERPAPEASPTPPPTAPRADAKPPANAP